MKIKSTVKPAISSIFAFGLLVQFGCGGAKQQALLHTIESPISKEEPQDFESIQTGLEKAKADGVNLVSPTYFLKSQQFLDQAAAIANKTENNEEYRSLLKEAQLNLNKANERYQISRSVMQPLIDSRQAAMDVEAQKLPAFGKLEKRFVALAEGLDTDDRKLSLEEIPKLTSQYRSLTIGTVQDGYLSEARENISIAKREKAQELAPKTLASAEQSIKNAEDYIQKDFRTVPMINQLSQQAAFESRRAIAITRQIKSWQNLSKEELAWRMEALLGSVGAGLQTADLRDQSLEANSSKLSELALALRLEREDLKTQLQKIEGEIPGLEKKASQVTALQQTKSREDQYDKVRGLFSENEAEVSRQKNTILISLKTIKFKSGDHQIPNQSYDVLKRVNKALALFPTPQVVVEGHTDSTGAPALNRALSEERAKAVKEYLASVEAVSNAKIEAVGYGSERPLASNATKDGRATNRRIDLIIFTP